MGQQSAPLPENGDILLASEIARWLRIGISTVYQWATRRNNPLHQTQWRPSLPPSKRSKHGSRLNKCLRHRGLHV